MKCLSSLTLYCIQIALKCAFCAQQTINNFQNSDCVSFQISYLKHLPCFLFQSITIPIKGDIGKLSSSIKAYMDIYLSAVINLFTIKI